MNPVLHALLALGHTICNSGAAVHEVKEEVRHGIMLSAPVSLFNSATGRGHMAGFQVIHYPHSAPQSEGDPCKTLVGILTIPIWRVGVAGNGKTQGPFESIALPTKGPVYSGT
jgi:hypothetical protein